MSDGPLSNLGMNRHWRRAMRAADNEACDPAEVSERVSQACLQDLRDQVPAQLIKAAIRLFEPNQQGQLFDNIDRGDIESLRQHATGFPLAQIVVNYCHQVAGEKMDGAGAVQEAIVRAVREWTNRHLDQAVRESVIGKISGVAQQSLSRLRAAIAGCGLTAVVGRFLDNSPRSSDSHAKGSGIDDGPRLPS